MMLVAEHGWRNAVVLCLLMYGFLTLAFAAFSSWVVVAVLLLVATAAREFVRWRRERADAVNGRHE
jgi:ABC-type transport system involved in cytochrome bd biosynthesis fused ATPase/permease subunit